MYVGSWIGNRLGRWALIWTEHEFDIIHRPGKQHENAGALSRAQIHTINEMEPIGDREKIKDEQRQDPEIQKIIEDLQPTSGYFFGTDGILYIQRKEAAHEYRALVPIKMENKILESYHDLQHSGHLGIDKTPWKSSSDSIGKACISCNERKTSPHEKPAPLQSFPDTSTPFERVSIDIAGPFNTSDKGNKYILTFQDAFFRYPEAIAIKTRKWKLSEKCSSRKLLPDMEFPKKYWPIKVVALYQNFLQTSANYYE